MEGGNHRRRWTSLKQRLGFKGMGCCGATWRPTSSTLTIMEALQEQEDQQHMEQVEVVTTVNHGPAPAVMNLAMALAAERNSRDENVGPTTEVKSLMRLIEETDGVDWRKKRRRDKEVDGDWVCCVCMERSKGAAFIPCGHTFCRVCSREMWVNRGSCPLCNRSILEILDIF
ncbi:uncharacterized protein LOC132182604 [Corylus avellana]|uniref:uncharacterized protein LOC132182604 n=1 Tax=Corylus avellana TaxID=13451 RepID=UPI001E230058|nr:uncharacterized protein LOC132182604 [Corylus avellana]XP_059451877.1 uncharacterized protein LOC132182604 [Corylus avellana]XP_059451878.1 uncharacterized protein LOC132182604 [Corylus avellana]XP_059451879.1 uncharacterized protein LOC132182604 [Corylus avellana]XP_059451880.1 uncharacterized protein LOC132182604 [Corylus avellana]XP_059451881.1 uncharacterized protein LOC132182604 [Corylus avellana]XP_059451882.1 uncharacterized protein LOC132182604 [Corylus avellana]